MRMRAMERWREDRGSSLIEFALISFMFIILLAGVVEMGRMVLVYTTIANAARAGARYAIVHGGDRTGPGATGVNAASGPGNVTNVQTVVKNFASAGLLNTSALTITVSYPNGNNTAGSPVTVRVMYTYDPFVNYFGTLLNKTLGSTSQGVITY
jgi:Flp pilus assembly protein TadG